MLAARHQDSRVASAGHHLARQVLKAPAVHRRVQAMPAQRFAGDQQHSVTTRDRSNQPLTLLADEPTARNDRLRTLTTIRIVSVDGLPQYHDALERYPRYVNDPDWRPANRHAPPGQ